eukprot:NODE_343_length_10566_cov_0.542371.p4 type:complete len:371 gc:universal NODE_343_length_10566_cov_0.542371:2527-3639(+)
MQFALAVLAATCQDTRKRKEIRDLSADEWMAYKSAIRAMQSDGSYQRLGQMHIDAYKSIHGDVPFLQWHRIYLCKFEDEVRKHSSIPDIGLPYYAGWKDSSKYGPGSIEKSPVFQETYLGAGDGGCVDSNSNTIFANQRSSLGGDHCISREFSSSKSVSQDSEIQHLVKIDDYTTFTNFLQYNYHAEIHFYIGGDMKDIRSINDPAFFNHHGGVDYLYDKYQSNNNDYDPNNIRSGNSKAKLFEEYTYGDSHANRVCCGDYQEYSGGQGIVNETAPPPPPEATETESAPVLNEPATTEELAALGIPADASDSQNQWNNFKMAISNGTSGSFISDLVNSNLSGSPPAKNSSSSFVTLGIHMAVTGLITLII